MAGRKINVKEFAGDFRSGLHDMELMRKYELSPRQLQQLLRRLVEAKALTEDEASRRSVSATGEDTGGLRQQGGDRSEDSPTNSEAAAAPPDLEQVASSKPKPAQRTQKCPFCSEEIPVNSLRCRHCDEWLDGTALGLQPISPGGAGRSQGIRKIVYGIVGQVFGSLILILPGKFGLLVGALLLMASMVYYIWGCCQYITSKGYHIAWGLLGFIPCFVGLLILLAMPDQT